MVTTTGQIVPLTSPNMGESMDAGEGPDLQAHFDFSMDVDNALDYNLNDPGLEEDINTAEHSANILNDPGSLDASQEPLQETASLLDLERDANDQNPYAEPLFNPQLDDIGTAFGFIKALREASLDSELEPLDEDLLYSIRNPRNSILTVDDPDERLSLDIFLSISNASEETYSSICRSILKRYPDSGILTYYKVKKLVSELSGVVPIIRDMCVKSCIAFSGPFAGLNRCPICDSPRYKSGVEKIPEAQFHTFPLAPQLQALWRTHDGALSMCYRQECTDRIIQELNQNGGSKVSSYTDFFDGFDYIEAVKRGDIKTDDMVLMLSIDGAQLYRNKVSECWIYIWVILDHAPDVRYKKRHILPGGIIPGPGKPKNLDSFIFPGLHHLAAIQKEGLSIWDAAKDRLFTSDPFLALATGDGPAMACISGCVGHHGKRHCRFYCPLIGRHKPSAPTYYPARFKPDNYSELGCAHEDVDIHDLLISFNSKKASEEYDKNLALVVIAKNKTQYEKQRRETGIAKPSIISGISERHRLSLPGCFAADVMHLPALNLPDLFIPLWRGNFECDKADSKESWNWAVLKGDVWKSHGKKVADTTPYIPGSFDRPPRNPAEKINSGYKAWEFLLYFYGLGPCLFFGILPELYWKNYCKLVRSVQILLQEEILPEEVKEAHRLLTAFSDEFENYYVQRKVERLHFVRPSVHSPSHLPFETVRVGPGIIYSQWAMERTIGNLGEEIKQHSSPFSNLAQRGLRRCQINALKAMIPDLEPAENLLPRGARDLGDGYALLTATDRTRYEFSAREADALKSYLRTIEQEKDFEKYIFRWSRIRLPNGQVARSAWREDAKQLSKVRKAKNVMVISEGQTHLAEILYYFLFDLKESQVALAMASFYGSPHKELYEASSKTYWTAHHTHDIQVIDVKAIDSVVMMAPDTNYPYHDGTETDRWFMMQKPGKKLSVMVGYQEQITEERL